jgi:hypothetical protein
MLANCEDLSQDGKQREIPKMSGCLKCEREISDLEEMSGLPFEEDGTGPYCPDCWEEMHPNFRDEVCKALD